MLGAIKRIIPWLTTSAFCLILILGSKDWEALPLQNQVNLLVSFGGYPISTILKMTTLWTENRRLRQDLVNHALDEAELREIRRQNSILRQMLDLRERTTLRLISAETVGFSNDEGIRGIVINKGADSGVRENQAVIAPEGLVGRVFRVYSSSAMVQLLGDPNLGVAATLVGAQESGIVHSFGFNRLRLDGVPVSAAVEPGDSAVTSGQGEIFPPGLLIGVVDRISPSNDGWLLDIRLHPSIDLRRVGEVFIIKTE